MVTWTESTLGKIGNFSKGSGISRAETQSGNIPCIRYGEIYTHHNDYINTFVSHISKEVAETSRRLKKGEILFTGSGETKEDIGKCVAFVDDFEAYAGGDIVILTPNIEIDSTFWGYYLNSPAIVSQKAMRGQGDAVVHINSNALATIEVKYPPMPEQRRIAAALSDTDAIITALERLIAKKRAVKQGAMQELLTGKRRLPGFEGEWVETTIGDLSIKLLSGYAFKSQTYITTGKYKIITIANVQQNKLDTSDCSVINKFPQDLQEYHLLKRGDILISLTGNVGRTCIVDKDYLLLNQRVGLFSEIAIDKAFFYHVLQDARFISEMIANAKGGAQPNLGNKDVYGYKLLLPPTVAEQSAIAEILSDIDAEIDKLTAKLNKLCGIKQGMMSELLTGRIRLIEQDATTITETSNAVMGRE